MHLHTVIVTCTSNYWLELPSCGLFYKGSSLSISLGDSLQKGVLFSRAKQPNIHAGSHSECISVWITCNATHYAMQPGLQPDKLHVSVKLCKAEAAFSSPGVIVTDVKLLTHGV